MNDSAANTAKKLYEEALVVDGLNVSNWDSPAVFESLRQGGVTAMNATTATWETHGDHPRLQHYLIASFIPPGWVDRDGGLQGGRAAGMGVLRPLGEILGRCCVFRVKKGVIIAKFLILFSWLKCVSLSPNF